MNASRQAALRIGFVVPSFDSGGLESVVHTLAQWMRRRGAEVTIFVEGDNAGYFAEKLPYGSVVLLRNRAEIFFAEIFSRRINLLHYNYSVFAIEEIKRIGIPAVYTLHNVYTWHSDSEFSVHANKIKLANRIVAVSSYARDYFARRGHIQPSEIAVVPNGVSFEHIVASEGHFPQRVSIDAKKFLFAQFSSFHRVKHHLLVIAAAEALHRRGRDFYVAFFGAIGDKMYHREVCGAIERSPAREVFLMPGHLREEEVFGALKIGVDCALLATLQEGCGNSALEAAALGVPVIMTDTGIAADLRACGADIDVIPASAPIESLGMGDIEHLSRTGDLPNLEALVRAMETRLDKKGASDVPRSIRQPNLQFPFTIEKMCDAYGEIFSKMITLY